MIKAIVIQTKPAWFCDKCKTSSQVLYINGRFRYCSECVPTDVKQQAVYYNQNGEEIKYKEQ